MKTLVALLAIVSSLPACKRRVSETSTSKAASNGVDCTSMTTLKNDQLSGIRIKDLGIRRPEKIRHINELNGMPQWYLAAVRPKMQIVLSDGGLATFPGMEGLRGVKPRGWDRGTWEDVAGGADADPKNGLYHVRLGPSSLLNDAKSLAIHEITHGIDSSFGMSATNSSIRTLFSELKAKPDPGDRNFDYRFVDIKEFLAMAIDEYYCNADTKKRLNELYPKVYAWVRDVAPTVFEQVVARSPGLGLAEGVDEHAARAEAAETFDSAQGLPSGPLWIASSDVELRALQAAEGQNENQ